MDMSIEEVLLIIAIVVIPTALWVRERYLRLMADGVITIQEVITEVIAVGEKADEVVDAIEDILDDEEPTPADDTTE